MTAHEFAVDDASAQQPRRVVEAEIKMPTLESLQKAKVELEPLRAAAEDLVLTGIGVAVLVGRGIAAAVRATHTAGVEAAENPGPVAKALLSLVRKPETSRTDRIRVEVPVLPIDNYDALEDEAVLTRLPDLANDQLRIVREYELRHARRTTVLKAIDRQLGVS